MLTVLEACCTCQWFLAFIYLSLLWPFPVCLFVCLLFVLFGASHLLTLFL